MRVTSKTTKRRIAAVLGLVLVVMLVVVGVSSGLGHPSVPSGDVAIVDGVDDGTVTQDQLDTALKQAATQAGLKDVPATDDPQYQSLLSQAMQSVLFPIWVDQEAKERGITISSEDVDADLAAKKKQSFKSEKEYQQYLKSSDLTEDQVKEQLRLQLVQDALAKKIVPANADPSAPAYTDEELASIYGVDDDAVQSFYDANPDSFALTASRDARVILNSSEAKVNEAKKALEADDSDASWKKVAAKFSQDQASKDRGGLLQGLTEGAGDPQLDDQVFSAAKDDLVGPFKTDRGYYLIQVTSITDAGTQPLDAATKTAIRQQLVSNAQQQRGNEFRNDFVDKWTARTTCAPADVIELCENYVAPVAAPVAGQPVAPPVTATKPIEPGTATIPLDGTAQQGLPQAPHGVPSPAATAGTLPPGAVPVGPDGQPTSGATDPAAAAAAAAAAQPGATPSAAPSGAAPTP